MKFGTTVCEPSLFLLISKRPFVNMRSCCKKEVSRYREHSTACVPHYARLYSLRLLKRIHLNLVTLKLQRLSIQPDFKISGHDNAEWSKNIIEIQTRTTSVQRKINPFSTFILFKNLHWIHICGVTSIHVSQCDGCCCCHSIKWLFPHNSNPYSEIVGFHDSDYEDYYILGCDAVQHRAGIPSLAQWWGLRGHVILRAMPAVV
jgi:hypothetical protein